MISANPNPDPGEIAMCFAFFKQRDVSASPFDRYAISTMNPGALADALTICCFRADCPAKDLESAVLNETIHRLRHPFAWHLRRWWRHPRQTLPTPGLLGEVVG